MTIEGYGPNTRPSIRMGRRQAPGNAQSERLDFALVSRIDWRTASHSREERQGEILYASLVLIGGRLHHVVWTLRGRNTRIISLRKANNREMARYEREEHT